MYDFDCGVTDVYAAVAETGSLVVRPTREHGRGLSLIPALHVAVVEPKNFVPDLVDLFDQLTTDGVGSGDLDHQRTEQNIRHRDESRRRRARPTSRQSLSAGIVAGCRDANIRSLLRNVFALAWVLKDVDLALVPVHAREIFFHEQGERSINRRLL